MAKRISAPASGRVAEGMLMLLVLAALLFGGGAQGRGDAVVHVIAAACLVLGLVRMQAASLDAAPRRLLWWTAAAVCCVGLQLLPLPAGVWSAIGPRAALAADLAAAGQSVGWRPMTVDSVATLRGLMALLVFASAASLAMTLDDAARRRVIAVMLLAGVAMAFLGFAQAAAGQHSSLRFYGYHHPIGAIGTFANRNHFASLLGMLAPLALLFAVRTPRRAVSLAWYAAALALVLASALSYSRAGFALTLAATTAAALVPHWPAPGASRGRAWLAPLAFVFAVGIAVAYYAWAGLMQRIGIDPLSDLRWQYLRYGREVLMHWLPWGSGAGTFPWVYAPAEPIAAMTSTYAARAHNDVLQVLIELGVPGAVLMLAFAALLLVKPARKIPIRDDAANAHHRVSIVTGVAIWVPLLHSLVDYPLRTLAVATVLAVLLATQLAAHRSGNPHAAVAG